MNTDSLPDVGRCHATTPSKFGLAVKARARHACELDLKVSKLMEGLCPRFAYCTTGRTSMWGGAKGVGTMGPNLESGSGEFAVMAGGKGRAEGQER